MVAIAANSRTVAVITEDERISLRSGRELKNKFKNCSSDNRKRIYLIFVDNRIAKQIQELC